MSGVQVIGELLNASAAVLAAVPTDQIKGGVLPPGFKLDAILVRSVSTVFDQPLKRGATRRARERVQVTALAATYAGQDAILKLVRSACDGKRGDLAGVTDVSVLLGAAGPDLFYDAESIFEGSQDFMVSYNEGTI